MLIDKPDSRAGRSGRHHKADGVEPRKQMGYRPDDDVLEMIKEAARNAGRTMSAEIDAVLRRAYTNDSQDSAEIEDLFGGASNFAYGFLMARIRLGIETEYQMRAEGEGVVEAEVRAAHDAITQACARSVPVERMSGPRGGVWRRVILTIHKNLTSGKPELWWPLSDLPKKRRRTGAGNPPLRPTISQLRAFWPFEDDASGATSNKAAALEWRE
jgi:hypothetical protein